ncbi:MAG: Na+/H+ antiporter NhaC [Opitutales bacterium]
MSRPEGQPEARTPRAPRLWEALLPVAVITAALAYAIIGLGEDPRIPILTGLAAACLMGLRLGYGWSDLQDGMVRGIAVALPAILILMVIGILIGLWIASGVVPLLIYYGLQLLSPGIFLPATACICAVVSLATGSSWTTAGTVGVALIGVGAGLGVSIPITAGAIISGAYFGDKMSPLSDTTNLAPAVAGSELFAHIRHMALTTGPSFLLAVVLFALVGALGGDGTMRARGVDDVEPLLRMLTESFNLTAWLLLAPAVVIGLVILRIPALPALVIGALAGALLGWAFQGLTLAELLAVSQAGFVGETGLARVDDLLTNGGLDNMMWTISLIICALAFGGVMEGCGFLEVIAASILKLARSTGSLVTATAGTCVGMNALAADQYLAIVVPGRMYQPAFRKKGLAPVNLSRVLEDVGTLTSPLVFWNTCGATMSTVLGVSAGAYWMFCFFNLINPLVSILYGYTGWTMRPLEAEGSPSPPVSDTTRHAGTHP